MAEDRTSVSTLALLAEQDPQQLQHRANSLRSLEFIADDSMYHGVFKDIKFPTLERLALDASSQNEEHLLKPYLQPALKAFIFYGGPISENFLVTLQVCLFLNPSTSGNEQNPGRISLNLSRRERLSTDEVLTLGILSTA